MSHGTGRLSSWRTQTLGAETVKEESRRRREALDGLGPQRSLTDRRKTSTAIPRPISFNLTAKTVSTGVPVVFEPSLQLSRAG